ncbi:MAG: hypothetical protein U0984_13135 [Prosthecobacter sp.]|nr:hypothetical protein [Prosthecobacter sp.]
MSTSNHDDLPKLLRAWRVEPRIPAGFQREVWQRIAAREAARENAFWPQLTRWLLTQFARPQYATALVVLSLPLSLGLAHVQAREANAKQWKQLEAHYADSVNPLAMAR